VESKANVHRMPTERVRATSTALLILGALLIGMLVLIFALIVLVAVRPRGTDSGPLFVALGLLAVGALALLAAVVFARRQARRIVITTTADTIEYEAPGILIRTTWANCARIGTVPIAFGFGDGIVLREPAMVRARFPGLMRAQRLDRVIPLSNVMWWWRDTELADDLARWAPHLGVARAQRGAERLP
jgi:hypothetical protein